MNKVHEIEYKGKDIDLVFTDKNYEKIAEETKTFCNIEVLEEIASFRLGGTVIEIGANTGNSVVYFSNFCDFDRVFAIEPSNESINVLYRNIKMNPAAIDVAIFEAVMWEARGICGITQKEESGKNEITAGEDVEMYTLDQTVGEHMKHQHISLLNISVGVGAAKVLKGAELTLKGFKPEVFIDCSLGPVPDFPKMKHGEYKQVGHFKNTDYYHFSYFPFA